MMRVRFPLPAPSFFSFEVFFVSSGSFQAAFVYWLGCRPFKLAKRDRYPQAAPLLFLRLRMSFSENRPPPSGQESAFTRVSRRAMPEGRLFPGHALFPLRLTAGCRTLNAVIVVRIHEGEPEFRMPV
jgi:hypothetical protein